MKNDFNEKTEQLYKYFIEILKFENETEKLYKNYDWGETNKAFIIKLTDYETFKDIIFYDILKKFNKDEMMCKTKIEEFINSSKIKEIVKIEKVIIRTSDELKNLLNEKNEYKLISLELGNIICKDTDSKRFYIYLVDYPEMILYIDIDDIITLGCNNNVINNDSYITHNSDKLINLAKSIIEYNELPEKLKNIFKDNKDKTNIGYLINKKWIEQWKEFVNYDKINFNIENKDEKISEIIKQILFNFHNEKKVKKPEDIQNNILKFVSRKKMKEYLNYNSLGIINNTFYHLITKYELKKEYEIPFSYANGKITIYINNKPLTLNCKNNIINSKYNEKFEKIDDISLDKTKPSSLENNEIHNNNSIIEEKESLSSFVIIGISNDNSSIKEKQSLDFENIEIDYRTYNNNQANDNYKKNNKDIFNNDFINNVEPNNYIESTNDINNIIKKEEEEKIKFNYKNNIKNNFICSPLIGLQNIGATCYMNSTLQCFCHIEKFVNFFKYNPKINNYKNKNNLTSSFILLIDNLWPDNYDPFSFKNKNKYYVPEEFKKKISKMNPLFEGIAANDSKDLVNFIIMTLHEELNKANNKNNIINNIPLDQRNKQLMFNNFSQDFMDKNKSIISDLFYSINCSITECLNCHNKLYNYQTYFFLIFPLEEVRKYKIKKINNNNYIQFNQFYAFNIINNMNINEVNIYECFDYDKKCNIMSGENSLYCNNCKINCNGSMMTYLVTGPEILILILNRGKGIEFDVKINFQENLNLYNYIEYKDTGYNYKLIGVITHIGESSMSGHFIAYCRDPIINKWFKYNDAIVTEIIDFKEVINFAMPYLLFYQKIH